MKKLVLIFIFIFIVVIAGIAYLTTRDHKPVEQSQTIVPSSQASPVPSTIPTNNPNQSGYSTETKTRSRNEFVNTCMTKGHYSNSECNCAADYLAQNYSETELAKMYFEYHSTSKIPTALESAAKVCVKDN